MIRLIYIFYQICIALPIILVCTILTAITTIIGSIIGSSIFWGYYPGMIWGRLMCWIFLLPVHIKGRDHINKGESYIIVANHQSYFDAFIVYGFLGIKFKWLMKQEIQKIPLVGAACKAAGHIFIDRSSGIKSQENLKIAEKRLVNGMSLVIFPEGTRTHDGQIGKFKRGAFQIAEELHLPILPVTIDGAYNVMPRKKWFVTWHKINITIHKPIPPKGTVDTEETERITLMRQSSDEAHKIISEYLK